MWILRTILRALFEALFGQWQRNAEKPPKIEDAKTPENIKSAWTDYTERERAKLRDSDNNSH